MQTRSTSVAIIGAGRVGTAFGVLLQRAGHQVVAATGREQARQRVRMYLPDARFHEAADSAGAARAAEAVLIAVPDDAIASACMGIAAGGGFRSGQFTLHLSGALRLSVLEPARAAGAEVLSLHPLQTVPTVDSGIERLPGSAMAVTAGSGRASAMGAALARDVGGVPFTIQDAMKPLYHAAAVFSSNYLVTVESLAERLFLLAGVEDPVTKFEPLARAALDGALARGPGEVLTGPAARGDVGTVALNLEALAGMAPVAVEPYIALARAAASLAVASGRLSHEQRGLLEEELARWG